MKMLSAVLGQSNEQGANVSGQINKTTGYGAPTLDPVLPNGSNGSPWPTASQVAGSLGHWVAFKNHARGSTSLCDVWVGRARNYAFAMLVTHGSYVIAGGNIYKAVGTVGNFYTLNVAPSSGVGTSGLSSWTNLGAVTSEDIDGAVYAHTSSRFDPNGYIAAIKADLDLGVGYDRKSVIVSIGQSDKTLGSTETQYKNAMVSVANYFTSNAIEVYLGMTNYGATDGMDAYITGTLQPARLTALNELSSNSLVHAGADLRTTLGVLPTTPTNGAGLLADNIHMNLAAATKAGIAWGNALIV